MGLCSVGLLWDIFMRDADVRYGLEKLEFNWQ